MSTTQIFFAFIQREYAARKFSFFDLSWIMAFVYFLILVGKPETEVATNSSIHFLISLIGMTGVSSFSLKSLGSKSDKQPGFWMLIGLLVPFALMMLIPWLFLPINLLNSSLVAIEGSLILIAILLKLASNESDLKNKVISLLSFRIVPLAIAFSTFYNIGNSVYPSISLLISLTLAWQIATWIRKEIIKTNSSLKVFVGVIEALCMIALGFFMFENKLHTWIILCAIAITIGLTFLYRKKQQAIFSIDKDILDRFFFDWFALIFLIGTIFIKTEVTVIFLVHLIFLRNAPKSLFIALLHYAQSKKIVKRLFTIQSFNRGLIVHLIALIAYTLLFCGAYKLLEFNIEDDARFFELQKSLSKGLVLAILLHGILIVRSNKSFVLSELKTFALEKGSAYNLAIVRIVFFWIITGSFYGEVFNEFEHWTHLPDSARSPLPFIGWLIEILPITPEFYKTMGYIGLGLGISVLFGFKTRLALILYIPVALYLWGVPNFFGKLNHRHIMVWVPIFLALSPCADVLSVDAIIRRIRKKRIEIKKSVLYAIPLKMIWVTLGIIYASSGFHKLWNTGLFWALSDNLKNQIQLEWIEQYDSITSIRIDQFPLLLNIGALGVILMEIFYPVLIIKSYTRIFAVVSAFSLHLSAGYFLFIDFFHLRVANLTMINWAGIKLRRRNKIDQKRASEHKEVPEKINFKRLPILYLGGTLIVFNLIFSIFEISSWPFSVYPSYSAVVPNQVDLVQMNATDINGKTIDVKRIGKEAKFRWETIRPFEQDIAQVLRSEDTTGLHDKLYAYWQLWETKVDSLDVVTRVEMSLITTELAPEKRHIVLDSVFLGNIHVENQ